MLGLRHDYVDKLGRKWHWDGTKYLYVKKEEGVKVHKPLTYEAAKKLKTGDKVYVVGKEYTVLYTPKQRGSRPLMIAVTDGKTTRVLQLGVHSVSLEKARKAFYVDSLGRGWKWDAGRNKYMYVRKSDMKNLQHPPAKSSIHPDLRPITDADVVNILTLTKTKERIFPGQKVKYTGRGDAQYSGKEGKYVATVKGGAAAIKFPDGHVTYSKWVNVKPVGKLKGGSIYDGLKASNIHRVTGTLKSQIDTALDQKIEGSDVTLRQMCNAFKDQGFTMMVVGGSVRDFLQGKSEVKDLDFIVNCTDNEIKSTVASLDATFLQDAVTNSKLGLVSFRGVDITPIHMHDDVVGMAKGGTLRDDGEARDFTVNSLQVDPLRDLLVDPSGRGVIDVQSKQLQFNNEAYLSSTPRYLLRFFKFVSRGYEPTVQCRMAVLKNLKYVASLSPCKLESFFERQIAEKDGLVGLDRVSHIVQQYDKRVWNRMESAFIKVRKKYEKGAA